MAKNDTIKVTASFDEEYLVNIPEAADFTGMLRDYKQASFAAEPQNIITPNENIQMQQPCIHPFFGRDREFDYPKRLLTDIRYENLTHVHLVDPTAADATTQPQWYRTSNASLVYSGFHVDDDHFHLYVLDLLNDPDGDAHKEYGSNIEVYLEYAAHYRRTYKM